MNLKQIRILWCTWHGGYGNLLNLVGDLVDINAAVVSLLLVVTVPALKYKWDSKNDHVYIDSVSNHITFLEPLNLTIMFGGIPVL